MKSVELDKAYNPKDFEDSIYQDWRDSGCFEPIDPAKVPDKDPYVIVIPPPNVTGVLHMGHGLNNSMQDICIRYHRMNGDPTLWIPGSDHAGIATQHVVEKKLRAKGIERRSLGREKFVEETWKVTHEHHDIIKKQLEKLGCSCDWKRERFTLDEGLSKAVREVFVSLYERGLIYKGEYLVNWCPSCGTALADDEVEHEDDKGAMYHIKYPVVNPPAGAPEFIEIATTRPETMFGDTAVAYNPKDERYTALKGLKLKLPLTNREIPLVADSYVDIAFGTGLVKITPAHDPNDFEMGKRQNFEIINILTPDAKLNDNVPEKYRGLDVKAARKVVIEDLTEQGYFLRAEPMTHSVGHCYRCDSIVEPYLSKQWFVKMKPMADKALAAWRKGEVRFYPKRWENTYENWLTNIRDWCISRQLWWGHRIPAWTCADCGEITVSRTDVSVCPKCGSKNLHQDEDVLDTWFSSWLWPFSTLGWPDKTTDLANFFPTSTLLTAYDIIFFWVSRMIMASLEFTGQVPFRDVCMTTLVRDKQGRKMSKSLGNGIDPLEIIDMYGADALRFTLAFMFKSSQDILINKDDFKLGSRFANKIWNASRYILMNLDGRNYIENAEKNDLDKWILNRLNKAAIDIRDDMATYRFNDAANTCFEYFWNDFCDWYVEATKLSTRSDDENEKDRAVSVLLDVLEESLALLHPFLPYVTEEIYSKLPNKKGKLILHPYPMDEKERNKPEYDAKFEGIRNIVTGIRNLRAEFGIPQEKKLHIAVKFDEGFDGNFLERNSNLVLLLANAEKIEFLDSRPKSAISLANKGFETYVFAREAVDIDQLATRFKKDLDKESQYIERTKAKLSNESFVKSAPEAVVAKEKEKLETALVHVAKLQKYLSDINKELL